MVKDVFDVDYDWFGHSLRLASINTMNVFSFKEAQRIVEENNIRCANAGICEDWSATADKIYDRDDGGWLFDDSFAYVWSKWGSPILMDMDSFEEYPCFVTIPYSEYKEFEHDFVRW